MKAVCYFSAILAVIVGGGITFAVVQWLGRGSPNLPFAVGAVLGTQIAAFAHHRSPGVRSTVGVKARVGAALALGAILLGTIIHALWKPFGHPEIIIPLWAVGTFVFPFGLFDLMWKAFSEKPNA